jgi:hypothetical protein
VEGRAERTLRAGLLVGPRVARLCLALWAQSAMLAVGAEWQAVKSKHFLVSYACDGSVAREIADGAEKLYDTIASDLGYTRYGDFWLWDRRARILVYPTAKAFALGCDAPAWAAGKASHLRREIAFYLQGTGRLPEGILAHELAHLILNDFVGAERVPLWLAEGFAQWEQSGRKQLPSVPKAGAGCHIPFAVWANLDIRRERDPERVGKYYAQSASVVGFLIQEYGGERFGRFCRALRDGKLMEEALESVYADSITSLAQLEKAWLRRVEGGRQ